jgi:CRISP-associated protein Cas1
LNFQKLKKAKWKKIMSNNEIDVIRVMALHALEYCERLFYLEEVEELYLADAAVYSGRSLHENLKKAEEEKGEWTSLELSSTKLGLVGKVDALRKRDGMLIPYEHKKGRSQIIDKKAFPWSSDAVQVCAYAMMLEEETGQTIPEARIHYHAENVTVKVPVDDSAREKVLCCINKARKLRSSCERPPVTSNDRLCIKCSLAPLCLPEEERVVDDNNWDAIRLFPPGRDKLTLHITEPGTHVSRSGDTIKVYTPSGTKNVFPMNDIQSIVIHGFCQITTQALHACSWKKISIHYLSGSGRYISGILNSSGNIQRKIRQYKSLTDEKFCLELAKRLAASKVEGSLRYILRSTRGTDRTSNGIKKNVQVIRECLKKISGAKDLDSLRGFEGMAAKNWFASYPQLLKSDIPEEMKFLKRSRRPPRDRINALLGFGYALLYQAVFQAINSTGLEPALGFYHQPRSSASPLVLDIMELFRVSVWDIPMIGSINRMQWDIKEDFDIAGNRVWLSKTGRKKAITLFEKRLQDSWKHPVVNYSMSYSRLIELEVRLLEKEWTGKPGLFAKMRLR